MTSSLLARREVQKRLVRFALLSVRNSPLTIQTFVRNIDVIDSEQTVLLCYTSKSPLLGERARVRGEDPTHFVYPSQTD